MENILYTISYSFVMSISLIIIWHKLLDQKIDFKNKKMYITFVAIMATSTCSYLFLNRLRVIVMTGIFMFFVYYLFKTTIQKTILTPIFYDFILLISEFITLIILSIFLGNNTEEFIKQNYAILISNVLISIISVGVVYIKFVRNLYNKILSITDKIRIKQLIILCLILIIFLNIYVMSAYYKVEFGYWITANFVLAVVFFVMILYYFKTKNKLNKVSDKYSVAIKSLKDYETMMTKYRVANHENKNLLLTVRAMILNKEKDIPKFIDNIIEDKYEDDEKLLFQMSVIPAGGLRATIYSEIIKINENNIKYSLHIDRKFKAVDLIELDTSTTIDVCKIIGVFIDNAIEEVTKLKRKEISISFYIENNNLNIKISNNYGKNFDITKIGIEGYTTKRDGHGYGLSLVNNIVRKNSLLEHNMEVNKKYFSQIISIKYNK